MLKKIYLISLLAGCMFLNVFNSQGQKPVSNNINQVVNSITFSAGANVTICNESEFITQGVCKTNVLTMWQSSGDGIFENSNNLVTTYTPGVQDIYNGSVTLSLVLFPMGGSGSEVIYDDMILYLGICRSDSQLD